MKKIFYTVLGGILLVSIGMAQVPTQQSSPQSSDVPVEPPAESADIPIEPPASDTPIGEQDGTIGEQDGKTDSAPDELEADDVEHLLRGPVHEAFAEPIQLSSEDPLVVPKAPPEPIEEIAPNIDIEQERNSVWIPGYWAWDDEREDFIWVSGVWRNAPVGRQWRPGQWIAFDGGYRWVPGRWGVAAGSQDPEQLLPPPPESLEEGPNGEPPSEDRFWVPGAWRYENQRYVWRPGFWSGCHAGWVWVPDYYVTAVNGCYHVPGYWDYGWEYRGTLFAPCYFGHRRHIRYSPSIVVDFAGVFNHLWVRPGYCHYYFGDYYADRYVSWGFFPWYRYHHRHRHAYDPLYVHYRWKYRRHRVDLHRDLHRRHAHYRRHSHERPAHNYRDHEKRFRKGKGGRQEIARRLHDHRGSGRQHIERGRRDVLRLRSGDGQRDIVRRTRGSDAVTDANNRGRNRSLVNRSVDIDPAQARERARRNRASGENGRRTRLEQLATEANGRKRSQNDRITTIDPQQSRQQAQNRRSRAAQNAVNGDAQRTSRDRVVDANRNRQRVDRIRSRVGDLGRNQTQANNNPVPARNQNINRNPRPQSNTTTQRQRNSRGKVRSTPQEVFRRSTPEIQQSNAPRPNARSVVDRARASSQRRSQNSATQSRNMRASATQVERPTRASRAAESVRSIRPSRSSIQLQTPNASRTTPRSVSRSQPRSSQPSMRSRSSRPSASSFRSSTRSSSPSITRSRASQAARGAMSRSSGGSRSIGRSGMSSRGMSSRSMSSRGASSRGMSSRGASSRGMSSRGMSRGGGGRGFSGRGGR